MIENFYDKLVQAGLPVITASDSGEAAFDRSLTDQEIMIYYSIVDPVGYAKVQTQLGVPDRIANIPGWATWNDAQAQNWIDNNIGTPLTSHRATIATFSGSLSLSLMKQAFGLVFDILDKMLVMLKAIAKLLIALRDK